MGYATMMMRRAAQVVAALALCMVVEARRGAFLSTSGSFKMAKTSNRGGNTEEDEAYLGESMDKGDECIKSEKTNELVQKLETANKALSDHLDNLPKEGAATRGGNDELERDENEIEEVSTEQLGESRNDVKTMDGSSF